MQNPRVAQGSIMEPMTYSSQIIPVEVKRESKIWNVIYVLLNEIWQNIVVQTANNRLKDNGILNNLHTAFTWAKESWLTLLSST